MQKAGEIKNYLWAFKKTYIYEKVALVKIIIFRLKVNKNLNKNGTLFFKY